MAPRKYTQHRRAETAAATRERVLRAAAEVYRERGISSTTIQAIAARADVARGTVVNHFGGPDGLLEAVLDEAVAELAYPDERVLDGATTIPDRIGRFVDAMFRFFERSAAWWGVFKADLELPALKAREREYDAVVARFRGAAFGHLAEDRVMAAAVRSFVDYGPMYGLLGGGLSLDEAIEVVTWALVKVAEQCEEAAGT